MAEQSTLPDLLAASRQRDGAATAIVYGGEQVSYSDLDDLSCRAAEGLSALGIGAGDRVAFWLPNTVAYMALYLACCRLGAIAVAVNTRFRALEVGDIIGRVGAKTLIMWPGFRNIDFMGILGEVEDGALDHLANLILYGEGEPESELPPALRHCRTTSYRELIESAPAGDHIAEPAMGANIFTTSGTTKAPKFVLHSQAGIAAHARDMVRDYGPTLAGGALMIALPFCGVFGFTQATLALAAGVPMVIMSAFEATRAVELIDAHRVHGLFATDDMIEALLAADPRNPALPSVRFCAFGAFNTDPEVLMEQAESRGLTLIGLYGMSELQALFARQLETAPAAERVLGGGKLCSPKAEVRVRDPESGRILAHGEQGELELKGPSLMTGYYQNPEATVEAFTDDGFLRTGDMGYSTGPDSFVYLARMGDALRLGGFLVSPAEIEAYLQRHESVAGAQVVSATLGGRARAVAFVILRGNARFDEAALREFCLAGLAKFKVPAVIYPLDSFPVTPSANGSKIQRAKLRQWAVEWAKEAGD